MINTHPWVRMSLVKARRNAITGAIVTADVVLAEEAPGRAPGQARAVLTQQITEQCRAALAPLQGTGDGPLRARRWKCLRPESWCARVRNVIVTGASRGLGLGIATALCGGRLPGDRHRPLANRAAAGGDRRGH